MRASRALVGWAQILMIGCAAGTTDDFFKVGELAEDTASDSVGPSTVSSGGFASSSDGDGSVASSSGAASAVDSSAQVATIGSTTTTGAGGVSDGSGGVGETSSTSGAGSSGGTGAAGNDSAGGTGGGGTGGTGGAGGTGGTGGTGGVDEPVVYVHEFDTTDDCVEVQCPEEAPHLVACDITFISWYQNTFCLAQEGDGVVFIKAGNTCTSLGSTFATGSTITCSSEPLESDITSDECVTNQPLLELVSDRCDCFGSFYIDGC